MNLHLLSVNLHTFFASIYAQFTSLHFVLRYILSMDISRELYCSGKSHLVVDFVTTLPASILYPNAKLPP